jgi:tetratricopeptide (TPR) repeat protein
VSTPQLNSADSSTQQHLYDVFLSHRSSDKPQVEAIAARLEDEERLKPFLDKWHIVPGEPWQEALEDALDQSRTCAVFLGASGLGPWENEEMRVALDERVRNKAFRVIPVLLPGAEPKDEKTWPRFLRRLTWVDFRKGLDDREAFRRLVAGIRGHGPSRQYDAESVRAENQPIFNLPFPRNRFFTGRDDVLKRLRTGFARGERVQSLNGLGGIGKTQTALEYAYRYRQDYKIVLWGVANSREALIADFAAMAGLFNLPEKNSQDQSEAIVAVRRWLENNDGWLLILDDADEIAMAREFIPAGNSGHVLLTTRAQSTDAIAVRNAVEKMGPEEGMRFLLRRTGKIEKEERLESVPEALRIQAKALAKELGGLPLALAQAAAFIEKTSSSFELYLDLYRSKCSVFLAHRGEYAEDHPSVKATVLLAFKKVEESNQAAADLLRVCAFLEADAIPEEIFSEGATELGEVLASIAESPLDLSDAIEEAGRFSLLHRHPEARTMSLHRLVQAVLRDEMDSDARRMWAERAVRAVNKIFPEVEYENWQSCSRLVLHAQLLAHSIEVFAFDFPEAARMLTQAGLYLKGRAQYAEAEPLYRRALAIREKVLGAEHPDVANSLINLAGLCYSQGKYAEAEPLYQRALAIREKVLGAEHLDVATSFNNLAALYSSQGKYGEAEPLYLRTLSIREKVLGPEHPVVANSLNNLAALYYNQGKYAEAEPLYQRALAIYEKVLGAEHAWVANSLNNLGGLYDNQGKYAEVEPLYLRALAIREKVLGAEHPDVATSLNNLAALYDNEGRYSEAEPLYQRALAISAKALGPEHPDVAQSLNNLAGLYYNQGKYNDAESLYQRALAIYEKVLGPEHPDVATSLNNLALLYDNQGKYKEAELLYQRAIAISEKSLGPEHPSVATNFNNLAGLYKSQRRYAEAEPLYRHALAIREKALGPEHPDVATSLNNLAGLYYNLGKNEVAEPLYLRALTVSEKTLGREHPDVATSLSNLALLYSNQGRYAEAEPLYLRALGISEKALGIEHPDVVINLNNLAGFYHSQGRSVEAEHFYNRAKIINDLLGQRETVQ